MSSPPWTAKIGLRPPSWIPPYGTILAEHGGDILWRVVKEGDPSMAPRIPRSEKFEQWIQPVGDDLVTPLPGHAPLPWAEMRVDDFHPAVKIRARVLD